MAFDEVARAGLSLEVELDERQINNVAQRVVSQVGRQFEALGQRIERRIAESFANIGRAADRRLGRDVTRAAGRAGAAMAGAAEEGEESFGQSFGDIEEAAAQAGGAIEESLRRGTQSAEEGLGQLNNIAQSVFGNIRALSTAAGAVVGGIAVKGLLAGKAFLDVSQAANVALGSILGTEEAASGLLDQVVELNNTSPFSRQVFISATQQLVAFGFEAEQVVPTLNAIQSATAAIGGTDADISALAQSLARLNSRGRVTLETLEPLTTRGVPVFEILADEIGTTEQAIQEMISQGEIGADEFIDIFNRVLPERFAGGLDNVFNTLTGAVGRFNARIRDIGTAILTPLIDPVQGGLAVDTLNNISIALTTVRDSIGPAVAPAVEALGNALVRLSEGFIGLTSGINTEGIQGFLEILRQMLPVVGALLGQFTGIINRIPLVSQLFAGLGGPGAVVLGLLAGTALQVQNLREAFGNLITTLAPIIASILPGLATITEALGQALGEGLAVAINALTPILQVLGVTVSVIINGFAAFIEILGPLGPLVTALTAAFILFNTTLIANPLVALAVGIALVIGGLVILFQRVEAVRIVVINLLKFALAPMIISFNLIRAALPFIIGFLQDAGEAIGGFINSVGELPAVQAIIDGLGTAFEKVAGFVQSVIDKLVSFIEAYNKIPFLPDITLPVDDSDVEDATESVERLAETAEDAKKRIDAAFIDILKPIEDQQKVVDAATTELQSSLDGSVQTITGLIDATQSLQSAREGLVSAQERAQEATEGLRALEAQRAELVADTTSDVEELTIAEEGLARIRFRLRDIDQDQLDIERELADLRGDQTEDDLAAADRAIERAKIALNRARRAELDLLQETNAEQEVAIDVSGLSLDDARRRLVDLRATLSAQRSVSRQIASDERSQEEAEEDRISRKLDVADAEQKLEDSIEARQELEETVSTKIRENEERLEELAISREEVLRQQASQIETIGRLQAGETTRQAQILRLDEQIEAARTQVANATKAVEASSKQVALAQAEIALKTAEANKDTQAIAEAQDTIFGLKSDGLDFDRQTNELLSTRIGLLDQQRAALRDAVTQQEAIEDAQKAALAATLPSLLQNAGRIDTATGQEIFGPFQPVTQAVIDQVITELLKSPGSDIRQTLRDILKRFGISVQGLAMGGVFQTETFARIGEAGKEAVLPLTRPARLAELLGRPDVLSPVLAALPRVSLPGAASSLISGSAKTLKPSGIAPTMRRADGPMTYGQADEIIALLKENGKGEIHVEAPVQVVNPRLDEKLVARRIEQRILKTLESRGW